MCVYHSVSVSYRSVTMLMLLYGDENNKTERVSNPILVRSYLNMRVLFCLNAHAPKNTAKNTEPKGFHTSYAEGIYMLSLLLRILLSDISPHRDRLVTTKQEEENCTTEDRQWE